jgi:hypothetical protein
MSLDWVGIGKREHRFYAAMMESNKTPLEALHFQFGMRHYTQAYRIKYMIQIPVLHDFS